ncbi:MAG: small subunit ribosomal protein S16 [Saprospiraceae bacterium]|jgi:small subunit ribosomal protein S16
MATKIRLQRRGRKRNAIYHIVAIDSRSKRDGRCIERLGQYNPNVHPAAVELDFERALHWVKVGAEMSDTAKTILSKEGVLLKNHLDGGVTKGAFKQDAADKKFAAWINDKESGADKEAKAIADKAGAEAKKLLESETKIKEDRAAAIVAKNSQLAEEAAAAAAPVVEEIVEEAPAEVEAEVAPEPAVEEAPKVEEKEEVAAPVEEVKVEEKKEEAKEEKKEDKKEEEKPAE